MRTSLRWYSLTPVRWAAGILAVLLVMGGAGGGTVYASQDSLPGDALYPVKTAAETVQMAVTWGAEAKADLHLKFAQRRVDEATQEAELNREVDAKALATIEKQLNDAIDELSGTNNTTMQGVLNRLATATLNQQIQLEQAMTNAPDNVKPTLQHAIEVTRRGNLVATVAYANQDYLKSQPSLTDKGLDSGQFKINGILQSIEGNTWDVGGVVLYNVHALKGVPAIGNRIIMEGLVRGNNIFISRIETTESSQAPTVVEGQYNGTNNGAADISGISVAISDNTSANLKPGDKVQLSGDHEHGRLDITHKESNPGNNVNTTELSGVLTAVDINAGTITVKSAGSEITINISKAEIKSDHGNTLTITDLSNLTGKNIELKDLSKRGEVLYARQAQIEAGDSIHSPANHDNGQGKNHAPVKSNKDK